MNAIIIEDEKLSAEHLITLLKKIDPSILVTDVFDSVSRSVEELSKGKSTDILFLDIQLSDGLSFEIFSKILIDTPVIFTTAYNEYAVKAFQLNSVDYLLKPIGIEDLRRAVDKFKKYNRQDSSLLLNNIASAFQSIRKEYKTRFLVKSGETIISVKSDDILHFIFEDGIVLLMTSTGKRFPADFTLDQLESLLDPIQFFRINRKVIIHVESIEKTSPYFNGRLKLTASRLNDDDARIVSRDRVFGFKQWLGK